MSLPIPITELERIAREAGTLGTQHFGQVQTEYKPDGTVVTEADRAVQRLILSQLREQVPDARDLYLLAEEDTDPPNPGVEDPSAARFIAAVDPLDGTTSFASGLPLWGVSIGLLADHCPVGGVVYMPLMGGADGWMYAVDDTGPARLNGAPLTVRPHRPFDNFTQLAVPSGFGRWANLPGFTGKLRSLGSTAHHVSLVASGALDAAVVGAAHLWDIAAGAALLERAGGVLCSTAGTPVDWQALYEDRLPEAPLVAGAPETVDALVSQLQLRPPPTRNQS
jgi:fructose-1,6-bisphosphatase/inositol monophosphatase family enzyme